MKTQLLEDIGQSATLTLVLSAKGANFRADNVVQDVATESSATPGRPRTVSGVWRQKPAAEPVASATPQPEPQPSEPIAAVQAPPPPAEPKPAAEATHGPVFEFTLPSPAADAPEPVIPDPDWFPRSRRPYLPWAAGALAGALVIAAGLWFYQERQDAGALALVASEVTVDTQPAKAVRQRPIAAKEFTLGPEGEVRVTPAAPAVPPLVLLEPGAPKEAKVESPITATPQAQPKQPQTPSKPERTRVKRAPERQLATPPIVPAERKSDSGSAMAATLKACREHGYQGAQCLKRGCTVTKYGFVCRGK